MFQFAGLTVKSSQSVMHTVKKVFGLSLSTARRLVMNFGYTPSTCFADLRPSDILLLQKWIYKEGGNDPQIRRMILANVQRLVRISSYRGMRHVHGLPLRGQRTKTNASTASKVRVFRQQSAKKKNLFRTKSSKAGRAKNKK